MKKTNTKNYFDLEEELMTAENLIDWIKEELKILKNETWRYHKRVVKELGFNKNNFISQGYDFNVDDEYMNTAWLLGYGYALSKILEKIKS